MSKEDKSLSDFKLPLPDFHREQFIQNCLMDCYVANEEDISPERATLYFETNHNKLNRDQRKVFGYIKRLTEENNKEGKLIFLDAPGGTGKTFTLNVLVSWFQMQGKKLQYQQRPVLLQLFFI